jgi:hypothetical protein
MSSMVEQNAFRSQSRVDALSALSRVLQRAKGDKEERFTESFNGSFATSA